MFSLSTSIELKKNRLLQIVFILGIAAWCASASADDPPAPPKAKSFQRARTLQTPKATLPTYRVPYQLTETKHVLVRLKINGKGPYNFIIDTGAPAMYIGTETAKKAGLKADERGWGTVDKLEIEGGAVVEKAMGRVEDPFQLIGMNRMNISGYRLDGILGYTVLAKFRIQFDFTRPHLVWTKLDWEPPFPEGLAQMGGGKQPTEVTAMSGLVNFATALVGRRPDPEILTRGFLGVELTEDAGSIRVWRVLPTSPAASADIRKGDHLLSYQKKPFKNMAELQKIAANSSAGEAVEIEIERDGVKQAITLKTGKAL